MFGQSRQVTNRALLEYPLGHPPERMPLDAVRAVDRRVIIFDRVANEEPRIRVADTAAPGAKLSPLEQTYVLHSPTGLEFGYGGSGPADTALNILSLVVSPREAWRMHQHFKDEVARVPREEGGSIALEDVRAWIVARYEAELADADRMNDEREMRELLADIEKEERETAAASD